MDYNEKIDYSLLILYKKTKNKGMASIRANFINNEQNLSMLELDSITDLLNLKEFAVFQAEKLDKRGSILPKGVKFAETDSFSKPGTSILDLESRE
jgi:hypothetical protein